jgi:prephenate dehydrogenase
MAFAAPELFQGRPWLLTPDEGTPRETVERVEQFVKALGAVPRVMTAADHDRVTGWVSHLPQLAASALMRVIGEAVGQDGLSLSGRGLRDTTRLASSPPHVWTDVCRTNQATIAAALDRLIAELKTLRDGLDHPDTVTAVFEAAARWRETLE